MTLCPGSGTDRFAPTPGTRLTPLLEPDAHYGAGNCWRCWARAIPLEDAPAAFGLPGTRQVLAEHEAVPR